MMDVRISGRGDNPVSVICRPVSRTCASYAAAVMRPRGVILAGVFGSNDIRPVSVPAAQPVRIVASISIASDSPAAAASC